VRLNVRRVKRVAPGLLLIAGLLPEPTAAQQVRKLEPVLAELTRPQLRDRILQRLRIDPLSPPESQPLGGSLALQRGSALEEPMLGVFIQVRNSAALAQIRALRGVVGAVVDDYVAARVPLTALEALAAAPDIVAVEAARALRLGNDSSTRAVQVEDVRELVNGEWRGATGEGAIVGVYDTGLDFMHDDFIDAQGQTRVVGLWDQTGFGTPPVGFSGGVYCSPAAVQQAIDTNGQSGCSQRDYNGHGTHVAGSAAGDGSAGDGGQMLNLYAGVAPRADLLIVNGGPGVFFENLIIDGLTWMRQEGLRLNRPIVANLSLGGQFGPHDGSRLYERMIDALSGPGFMVVISAGNNGINGNTTPPLGGRLIHARGLATGTATREFEIEITPYSPNADRCNGNYINISFWYEDADQLTIGVVRPDGSAAAATRGSEIISDNTQGRIQIDNGSDGINSGNGDVEAIIQINGCGTSAVPAAGVWRIHITPATAGSGSPYDMWIYANAGPPATGRAGFDNRFIVGSPGNAQRAVTVGAFVSRLCWPSIVSANPICYTQREELGDMARFSSAGPTRDGRLKPEIVAPGLGVLSAHSGNASISQNRVATSGVHAAREGTSMAAPHVTGAIAVLLGQSPLLTPEDVKAMLAGSAMQDVFTTRTYDTAPGGRPEDWWGFGKLNVRDALLALGNDEPSTLGLEAEPLASAEPLLGTRGTRLPLLQLNLEARGLEAIDITAIGFDVRGHDQGARLLLVRDGNGSGTLDASDPVVGSLATALTPAGTRVIIAPDSLRVQPFLVAPFFLAVELSGAAPNGATFDATLVPQELHSRGVRSGAVDQIDAAIVAVASGTAATTVLRPAEVLTFSANPVRETAVVFNFASPPRTAAVYTIQGRRIIDLCGDATLRCGQIGGDTFARWDLRNDEGTRVAPGVYLVIFQVEGQTLREKLMVLLADRL